MTCEEPFQCETQPDRDFVSFMRAASELCKYAEALSQPDLVYSEYWRVWARMDSVWGAGVGVWKTGEWSAKSVLKSLLRYS